MTSSPSSPQSPEHQINARTKQPEISTTKVPGAHKAGDSPTSPANRTIAAPTQKTRRIKRALTCEFDQKSQPNADDDSKPGTLQQDDRNSLLQLDPNQLANITTTNNPTGEQYLPLFSAIFLKQKRRMFFAPMDFQHFSIDALIDSGALVNCMLENEYQKLKNMSPNNILLEADPPPFKLQVANGDIETPIKTIQVQLKSASGRSKKRSSPPVRSQVPS